MPMASEPSHRERLAEHYDTTDTSEELAGAERDDAAPAEPMVTTSLRLPRSTMERLRHEARRQGVRPTQLIREWVETALAETTEHDPLIPLSEALSVLRQVGARRAESRDPGPDAEPRGPSR